MRFFLLYVYMLLLRIFQLRAVSFPEDDEPLNTVDFHCKSSKAVSFFK
jgi:semaphorin 6